MLKCAILHNGGSILENAFRKGKDQRQLNSPVAHCGAWSCVSRPAQLARYASALASFCKRVPSFLDYYATTPRTVALMTCFASRTPKNSTFSLSRSPTPHARWRGSERHCTPTPVSKARHRLIEQADEHRGAKTNPGWWLEVKRCLLMAVHAGRLIFMAVQLFRRT
jgi:hypothetical protein